MSTRQDWLAIAGMVLVSAVVAIGPAAAVTLYTNDNQTLYTLDSVSGALTPVGNYSIPPGEFFIGGLEFNTAGTLYGISAGAGPRLYTLDPATGAATPVGPLGIVFVYEGGLAFDPTDGTLYGVNQGDSFNPNLFTVNVATGQGTIVGLIGGGKHDFGGLAFSPAGQLYGLDRATNALWRIDKANPAGAGTTQVGAGLGGGIVMGGLGGMTRDSGTGIVYGYAASSSHLITVDLATGFGAVLHTVGTATGLRSLAFRDIPIGIEPSSWGKVKSLYRR
jgi:hypothetical protein